MTLLLEGGKPNPALVELAKRQKLEVKDDITAHVLSALLQSTWLRKEEHQYLVRGGMPNEDELELLRDLSLVDSFAAAPITFQGVLLLGATIVAVRKRLVYLLKESRRRVRFGIVYLLGGARPLDKDKESPSVLCAPAELPFLPGWVWTEDLPTTEAEMMEFVWQQIELPSQWKHVLINTPLQPMADGKTRHPNVTDTVRQWLTTMPEAGAYLVISSQPFVQRHTLNVEALLPENIWVQGVGYAASPTTPLKTFLDEAARLLHEELKQGV